MKLKRRCPREPLLLSSSSSLLYICRFSAIGTITPTIPQPITRQWDTYSFHNCVNHPPNSQIQNLNHCTSSVPWNNPMRSLWMRTPFLNHMLWWETFKKRGWWPTSGDAAAYNSEEQWVWLVAGLSIITYNNRYKDCLRNSQQWVDNTSCI
jgi:hypothetical protein